MKIKIICVGKLKEEYLKDALNEYVKRISKFSAVEIIEVDDEKIPKNANNSENEKVIFEEGERIKKHLSNKEYIIPLCIEGKMMSSTEFAKKISDVCLLGKNTITFIIGGSLGIREDIKNLGDFKLSFSPMTFPHQLMRIILCEQVYRAFKINANEEYHK